MKIFSRQCFRSILMIYKTNSKANLTFQSGIGNTANFLTISIVQNAVRDFSETIENIQQNVPIDIFSILGMRNLSAFIGEIFARSLEKVSYRMLKSNPHQDGYPDLLLMDQAGIDMYNNISLQQGLQDKAPFSPFPNGGIEIKATCGSVPTPKECHKKGLEKPSIGCQRIDILKSYDWKAHHQETNNLLGLLWDFINGKPMLVAVFFGNNLTDADWGDIVQPRAGGGRTTSVSIMKRKGVKKMYNNWVMVFNDRRYIDFLNKYNKGSSI